MPKVGILRKLLMVRPIDCRILKMLAAHKLFFRFRPDDGQEFGVEQDAACFAVTPEIKDIVQADRQYLMCRADIGIPP